MSDNNSICSSLISRLNKFGLTSVLTDKVVETMDGLLSTDTGSSTEFVEDPDTVSDDGINNDDKVKIDNMVENESYLSMLMSNRMTWLFNRLEEEYSLDMNNESVCNYLGRILKADKECWLTRFSSGDQETKRQFLAKAEECKREEEQVKRMDLLKRKEELELEFSKLSMSTSVNTGVSTIQEVAPTMLTSTGVQDTNSTLLEILKDLANSKIHKEMASQVFTPAALAKDGIKNFQSKRDPKIFNPNSRDYTDDVDSFLAALEIEFRTNYVPENEWRMLILLRLPVYLQEIYGDLDRFPEYKL